MFRYAQGLPATMRSGPQRGREFAHESYSPGHRPTRHYLRACRQGQGSICGSLKWTAPTAVELARYEAWFFCISQAASCLIELIGDKSRLWPHVRLAAPRMATPTGQTLRVSVRL